MKGRFCQKLLSERMTVKHALTLAALVISFEIEAHAGGSKDWTDELREAHGLLTKLQKKFEGESFMISPTMTEDELLLAREQWTVKRAEAEIEVKALEEGLGRAVLAGDGAETRAELRASQEAVTDANLALAEIDRLLPQAKANALRRQAADCREQAKLLESEAVRIENQVAKLLDKIQELEGCRYIKPGPVSLYSGEVTRSGQLQGQVFKLNEQASYLEMQADEISTKKVSIPQWQF